MSKELNKVRIVPLECEDFKTLNKYLYEEKQARLYLYWQESNNECPKFNRYSFGLKAIVNGELAGLICVKYEALDSAAKLYSLYIVKKYRRTGVASELITKALEISCERWQFDRFIGYLVNNNQGSLKLFQKFGFVLGGRFENYIYYDGSYYSHEFIYLFRKDYHEQEI